MELFKVLHFYKKKYEIFPIVKCAAAACITGQSWQRKSTSPEHVR